MQLTKVQNLKAPIYGIYLGPVEGRFQNSPNFMVRQSNGDVVTFQGVDTLNEQFSALQTGVNVKVEYTGQDDLGDGYIRYNATVYVERFVPVLESL